MRRTILLTLALAVAASAVGAQTSVSQPSGQKTLAATVGVYVFPAAGQETAQQNREEAECYAWAVKNTGSDPFDLAKRAEQTERQAERAKAEVDRAGEGAGARGAVGGAMMGALIGEIADDDPGEGAAYGAALGLISARRARRRAQNQAKDDIERQSERTQRATAEEVEGFKKAFSVCLEAKDYLVKI